MKVNITNFMNTALFMPLINAGHSTLSGEQDKIVINLYNDAFKLLSQCSTAGDSAGFSRICWALNKINISENVKKVMKYPEMYEKMMFAHDEFRSKIAIECQTSNPFNYYWQQYGQNVR